jgi:hypothetical protein
LTASFSASLTGVPAGNRPAPGDLVLKSKQQSVSEMCELHYRMTS